MVLVLEAFEGSVAGRAYINGPASTGTFGFSAVRRRAIDEEHVFAHEIGHNLGVAHDWYVSSAPGAFSSSKGYTSVTGRVLDIMAYWDLCRARNISCSQALLYSNPRLSHQGVPMGVPAGTSTACRAREEAGTECDADAVTTMVRMAPVVARFRNSRLALTARRLRAGEWWASPNGRFRLLYGTDGNLQQMDTRRTRHVG